MLKQGKTLQQSADAVGIDVKTARKYRKDKRLPSEQRRFHTWQTREDVFAPDWERLKGMLTLNPGLEAKTLMDWLIGEKPERYQESHLRTLQRRIKRWRALEGPEKEIYFPQQYYPGELSASDFTHMDSLGITIKGERFSHMFYHFVLPYSNWEAVSLCYSESFESLSEGTQNALWMLGGVPLRHRIDNLSAAVVNPSQRTEFTDRYQGLLDHYRLKGESINPRSPHENGDVEQSHHQFKRAVDQALMLRGSRDFDSIDAYLDFIETLVAQRNKGRHKKYQEELSQLNPLPARRQNSYRVLDATVTKFSTIRVLKNVYSVPSRLKEETVRVLVKASTIEIYYAQQHIETYPRLQGSGGRHINYRHLIGSLIRKPGAFLNYRYREELYPNTFFRLAWETLQKTHPGSSVKIYLGLLYRAANISEDRMTQVLQILLRHHMDFSLENVDLYMDREPEPASIPEPTVRSVDLSDYDRLVDHD